MREDSVRVDVWLWAVRIHGSRSVSTAACKAGHVRVNGARVKAAFAVRVGDEVRVRTDRDRVLVVRAIAAKRVGAAVVPELMEDRSPLPPARESVPTVLVRDRGAGRPTKRERRDISRLRGY